jgi:hypothetical protein
MTRTEIYSLFLITWVILVGSVAGSDALKMAALRNTLSRLETVVKSLETRRDRDRDPRHRIGEDAISPQEKGTPATASADEKYSSNTGEPK